MTSLSSGLDYLESWGSKAVFTKQFFGRPFLYDAPSQSPVSTKLAICGLRPTPSQVDAFARRSSATD
jgi:hypothetical protein